MKLSHSLLLCVFAAILSASAAVYFGCVGIPLGCILSLSLLAGIFVLCWRLIVRPIRAIEHAVDTRAASDSDSAGKRLDQRLETLLTKNEQMLTQEYSLQMLKKQAELHALQSQINPHFLYNTLDSIRGHALMQDMDEIADMTEALSTFFRYNISNTGAKVTLGDELENVENYMTIQQFRFGDRIRLSVQLDETSLLRYGMPKMTLQPVVENAVLHGLETTSKKGVITIQVQAVDECMEIHVRDNGIGMNDADMQRINERLDHPDRSEPGSGSHTGIALTNVCQRIKLCYGPEYGMHVFSTPEIGTEVMILIPLDLCDGQGARPI